MTPTSAEITLRGLVGARWVLIVLMSFAWVAMLAAPHGIGLLLGVHPTPASLGGFAGLLGLWALLNTWTWAGIVRPRRATTSFAGAHLLVDTSALTVLLGLTGGATNPFTLLFFVPITLATLVTPRWTWGIAGYALGCFALLFVWAPREHEHHFTDHLRGMWLAFGVSGLLVTHFVHRIALNLTEQREELRRLREQALADRHFASLGTLAAGAAHELGTPLGTLTILLGELPYLSPAELPSTHAAMKDALLRCKNIVERMATPELRVESMAAKPVAWSLAALRDIPAPVDVALEIDLDAEAQAACSTQPKAAVLQVLRELIANGADACRQRSPRDPSPLHLSIRIQGSTLELIVRDRGVGMTEDLRASAFDPFLSTKPEGHGMGLGLYFVRAQVRQLGGTIDLQSCPEDGTTVHVRIPCTPPFPISS